jgi:hypothetical protein
MALWNKIRWALIFGTIGVLPVAEGSCTDQVMDVAGLAALIQALRG